MSAPSYSDNKRTEGKDAEKKFPAPSEIFETVLEIPGQPIKSKLGRVQEIFSENRTSEETSLIKWQAVDYLLVFLGIIATSIFTRALIEREQPPER